MIMTIQEDEMYYASKYCNEYIKELTDFIVDKKRIFEKNKKECEEKINSESEDISLLKEKIDTCYNIISDNKERIKQISEEIQELEEVIDDNDYHIDNTVVTVYTSEYDKYSGEAHKVVDYERTRKNEDYIDMLSDENSDLQDSINALKREKAECFRNIKSLETMITNIGLTIEEKGKLIEKIKANITILDSSFRLLNNETANMQNELTELNKNILKCIDYIHSYGLTISNMYYKDLKNSYTSKDIFALNSETIQEEIGLLKATIEFNNEIVSKFAKEIKEFADNLSGSGFSKQVPEISSRKVLEIKKINDNYIYTLNILKKAKEFISAYEMVKI